MTHHLTRSHKRTYIKYSGKLIHQLDDINGRLRDNTSKEVTLPVLSIYFDALEGVYWLNLKQVRRFTLLGPTHIMMFCETEFTVDNKFLKTT